MPHRDCWSGRLAVGDGHGCYVGPTFATVRHAHHAVQLIFALETPVRVQVGGRRRWRRVRAAVVRSDVPHAYEGDGAAAVLVYLSPDSREGAVAAAAAAQAAALRRALEPALVTVATAAATRDGPAFAARVAELMAAIGRCDGREPAMAPHPDPRVAAAVAHLRRARGARVSLAVLAREASLSPSRLACLFRAETGLPVRRYALWLRLQRAAAYLARDAGAGSGLSTAAHEAGFADAAHMTRTFKRMFGVMPSAVVAHRGG